MAHVGHDTVEVLAAVVVVIGGAWFTFRAYQTRPARRPSAEFRSFDAPRRLPVAGDSATVERSLGVALAALSAGAALIHLAAAPSHYTEIGDLGAGFLIAAAFQGWSAAWWLGVATRRQLLVGIVGNLVLVAAWLYTRTVGLSIGPFAGAAEPVGLPDGASVVFELFLVAGLVGRWLRLGRAFARRPVARHVATVALVPVLGLVLLITSLATVAIVDGLDHGSGGGHAATHIAHP